MINKTITVHLLKIRSLRLIQDSVLSLVHDLLRPFKKIPRSINLLSFPPFFSTWELRQRPPHTLELCSLLVWSTEEGHRFLFYYLWPSVCCSFGLHSASSPGTPHGISHGPHLSINTRWVFLFSCIEGRRQLDGMNRGEGEVSKQQVTIWDSHNCCANIKDLIFPKKV